MLPHSSSVKVTGQDIVTFMSGRHNLNKMNSSHVQKTIIYLCKHVLDHIQIIQKSDQPNIAFSIVIFVKYQKALLLV